MNNQKENVIRENRTIEATKKNLMGPTGKLGVILQAFGTVITRQSDGLANQSFLESPFADGIFEEYESTVSNQKGPLSYRDEIPMYDDAAIENEGLLFDGLSRGMHLEITYWHADSRLAVSYKGYAVFKEISGELENYAPFPEWEDLVEKLYRSAKDRLKQTKPQLQAEQAEEIKKRKESFWQHIRMKWGF